MYIWHIVCMAYMCEYISSSLQFSLYNKTSPSGCALKCPTWSS